MPALERLSDGGLLLAWEHFHALARGRALHDQRRVVSEETFTSCCCQDSTHEVGWFGYATHDR